MSFTCWPVLSGAPFMEKAIATCLDFLEFRERRHLSIVSHELAVPVNSDTSWGAVFVFFFASIRDQIDFSFMVCHSKFREEPGKFPDDSPPNVCFL